MTFHEQLLSTLEAFRRDLASVNDDSALERVRVTYLGRKSEFNAIMRVLKDMSDDERRKAGAQTNEVKREIEAAMADKAAALERERYARLAQTEIIDISMPGIAPPRGHLHMTTQAIRDIQRIFERIGFTRVRYPEVEWEHYAFDALRIGADHPARDNWETFFMEAPPHERFGRMILTPHTTNGDVREMERGALPIRTMNIGKTYRRQSDVNHVPMFHQFEGLLVDRGVSVANLKGLFDYFAEEFFGAKRAIRLRPHHFRFTEPSFEIDVSCGLCDGEGCRMCKRGWLELGGAGILHPDVLRAGGVDPAVYTALAFGWGVERTASMRSGVNIGDLRVMYKNDVRFLEQF